MAARTAALWDTDWQIYYSELMAHTGLTMEQVILWDMAMTWREMAMSQATNMQFVKKHIEKEHGGDEPWKSPE